MTAQEIQNIMTPPETSHRIISRDRLINLLINNIEKNLIFIYSPPGYGKTSLVQSFLATQNWKYAWLNASCEFSHVYTFFKYLIYSLKSLNKNFGNNTIQIIESRRERFQLTNDRTKSVIDEIISTFVNDFKEVFKEDIILVIDDLQNIEDNKLVSESFNTLFAKIPRNLHLILLTRQIPNFNFLPLIEKEKMLRIGMEDLVFHFDEITELLKDIYSIECTEDGIKLLENNIGGWITGIHLILQSFGKDFTNIKIDLQRIPENIFNLLAEEIFKRQDTEVQNFLLLTSQLEDFDKDVCEHALGIKKSGEIIESLINKNLFIQPIPLNNSSDKSSNLNYHILFKTFLNSQFNKKYKQELTKEILEKVSNYYLKKKDIISSINYLIKAKDYTGAIPVIIENFETIFNEGKFENLWNWLSTIDNEIDITNPYITYYLGLMYKYYIGDLETSLAYLQKANESFKKQNDTNGLIKCSIVKAGVMLNYGRTQEVITELSELINKQTTKENQANLLYFLAYAHYQNSEYDRTIDLLNKSLDLSENGKKIKKKADIFNLLGNIELIKGNFKSSVCYYESVLEGGPNILNRFETLCNLVLMTSQSGKYKDSKHYSTQLDELIKNFPTPVLKIPYLISKQAYLFESRNYEENIKVLEEINSIAQFMNHKQYTYLTYRLMTDTYYYLHNIDKAKECFELASNLVGPENELENIELSTTKVLLYDPNGTGNSSEKTLLKAYEYYDTNKYIYSKVQIGYKIAVYFLKKGETEKAKKYIEESLNTASQNGYISFFKREYDYSKDLLLFARDKKICSEFVKSVINN